MNLPSIEEITTKIATKFMVLADVIKTSDNTALVNTAAVERDQITQAILQKYGGNTIQTRNELAKKLANMYSLAESLFTVNAGDEDGTATIKE